MYHYQTSESDKAMLWHGTNMGNFEPSSDVYCLEVSFNSRDGDSLVASWPDLLRFPATQPMDDVLFLSA